MKLFTIVLHFYFIFFALFLNAQPIVLGLGADCDIAAELKRNNLRNFSCPFDWVATYSFDTVTKVIEEEFQHWLDPNFLEYRGNYIYNSYYDVRMPHDFPFIDESGFTFVEDGQKEIVHNFLDFLSLAKEKYDRRIKRFLDLLNSDKPIIFIRSYATPNATKKFVKMMRKKYPFLKYKLVVLIGINNHENNKKNEYLYDWNIKDVQVIYCHGEDSHNGKWWSSEVWKGIFLHLGLIQ